MKKFNKILLTLLIAITAFTGIVKAEYDDTGWKLFFTSGTSMEPTIKEYDIVFGYRYKNMKLERNDIVICYIDGGYVNKRIIGVPGDFIELINGKVYVNGNPDMFIDYELDEWASQFNFSVILEDNQYFTLGDNRNWSKDCRVYENHYISIENIRYKVASR